ncbi:hypothetical protein GU944_001757 [Salmonella enterica]|nr:hypothetical protein [Salmonella enterica]
MEDKEFHSSVSMQCPTCGTTMLIKESTDQIRCARCGREITIAQLIEENGENIHSHVNELSQKVGKEFVNDLTEDLKKIFKNNKNIRIK